MNGPEKNSSVNEHTLNIRAGLPVLKRLYGLTMDEYDYLDLAVDALRDIKNFHTTEYLAILQVDENGMAELPCNVDVIDAVTSVKMGLKAFKDRARYEMSEKIGTDDYFTARKIIQEIEFEASFGLTNSSGVGYIPYQLMSNNSIMVDPHKAGDKVAIAFTGVAVDPEGFPMITRKQSNALAAIAALALTIKSTYSGNAKAANMLEFISGKASQLKQAASIPESISDNELDEILDAKTTFNRKSFGRPTRYSR